MSFYSILFEAEEKEILWDSSSMPDFFSDLNLDQIIDEILSEKEEYNLKPFFYHNLKDISTINYRLDIMKEFENEAIYKSLVSFSNGIKRTKEYLGFSRELHNVQQREKWLLDAAFLYCETLTSLSMTLNSVDLLSNGLISFNNWLNEYINSASFNSFYTDTADLHKEFNNINYSIQVSKDKVTVSLDEGVNDYCATINNTFESINEKSFDYQIKFFTDLEMCALETSILNIVIKMYPDIFNKLEKYYEKYNNFLDKTINKFDRELQFYISYIEYIEKLIRKGFKFAYPVISSAKSLNVFGGYDLALANKQASAASVVPNDFYLNAEERIYILTGPNQGGKTTFARAFGQINFLASIGCPVPCQKAELFLFDRIFTHFPVEEDLCKNAGRLKEELVRLKHILDAATSRSIIIINELFASTTSFDAYTMGKKILEHFITHDCICLYVTHIYELCQISNKTVSLVAAIDTNAGAARTYKIHRKPADGCAYANSIVKKYNLSYKQIKELITL